MSGDLEVLSYLFDSINDAVEKLEKSAAKNKIEETVKIKQTIISLSRKISEELK